MKKVNEAKTIFQLLASFLLVVFVSTSLTYAVTYYVSPAGNDSNNGTESSPFKTVGYAVSKAIAGDTVYTSRSIDTSGNMKETSITVAYSPSPSVETFNKEISVYPNPYIKGKNSGEKITFTNLPQEATISIYSLTGESIQTIEHNGSNQEEWNISGIVSGIYLYVISSGESVKKGKVSVIK